METAEPIAMPRSINVSAHWPPAAAFAAQFSKSVIVSVTNPQPIIFGISVLPQFIDPTKPYVEQAALMIAVYTVLVFVVMEIYAMAASRARVFLLKGKGPLIMKRVSAGVFVLIGLAVLASTVKGLAGA